MFRVFFNNLHKLIKIKLIHTNINLRKCTLEVGESKSEATQRIRGQKSNAKFLFCKKSKLRRKLARKE